MPHIKLCLSSVSLVYPSCHGYYRLFVNNPEKQKIMVCKGLDRKYLGRTLMPSKLAVINLEIIIIPENDGFFSKKRGHYSPSKKKIYENNSTRNNIIIKNKVFRYSMENDTSQQSFRHRTSL